MNCIPQLNDIERLLGLSANIRQCYQLNKFSFGDAIGTAKSTAMQCINNKFDEGKTILDNAINNIRSAAQDISDGAQLIAECSQFTVAFPSVAGLLAKVTCLGKVRMLLPHFLFSTNLKALNFLNSRDSMLRHCLI